ncbi:MAG: anti-toxin [Gammaproteobacteria bacterium]|nr:MAG: anti-toxin [Gammaproteobacteria bacterium]
MLAIRLPAKIEKRLSTLAKRTGRTKTYYATEAILQYMDDLEDIYLAVDRLEKAGLRWTQDDLERGVDLDS